MGTQYSLRIAAHHAAMSDIRTRVERELSAITESMSNYSPDSEVMRFNDNPSTDWVAVSPALYEVVAVAQEVAAISDGAFDVTVAPLVALWGFGPAPVRSAPPSQAQIASTRLRTGYRRLELRATPPALRKSVADMAIDLSAIAKGYAVDRLGKLLSKLGFEHWLVEIGGEILARGQDPAGHAWRIGIEQPDATPGRLWGSVEVSGQAVASSGNYRDFFEYAGRRYAHVIDPRSGSPVDNNVATCTVIHERAVVADALATAALVRGAEATLALAAAHNFEVLIAERGPAGLVWRHSPGFERMLHGSRSDP